MSVVTEGILAIIANPECILWNAFGCLVGLVFGCLPGLSCVMAMVLFLPVTFGMEPILGIATMLGVYVGGISGGMISAILIKIPGTAASMTTVFDGGPMADRGEAGKALGIGVLYSFIGGMISFIFLIFLAQPLSTIALKFSPFEYCSITIMALTIIASLSGKSMINGLLSGLLGLFLSYIGTSSIAAIPRFVFFGSRKLYSGLSTITLLIGIFAITEILNSVGEKKKDAQIAKYHMKGFGISFKEFREQTWNMIRSALIGVFVGILPGLGANTSSMFAYSLAQSRSKYPEKFGTGIIDGVIASETANNANTGGAMITMLALGIPGNTPTALLIAALTVQGINCGPLVFTKYGTLVYAIFTAFALANVFILIFERGGIKFFVKLLDLPKWALYPIIIVLCMVGAFSDKNRTFECILSVALGLIFYVFKKYGLMVAPCIIGFILGSLLERNYGQAMSWSGGSYLPFITRPISLAFLILTVVMIAYVMKKNLKHEKNILADDEN